MGAGEFGYRVTPYRGPEKNWNGFRATVYRKAGATLHTRLFETEEGAEWWARSRIAELSGQPAPGSTYTTNDTTGRVPGGHRV